MAWSLARWGRGQRDALERIVTEWRETLDSIEWPILALDREGRITRLNRAAQRLAGMEFPQLVGRPVGTVGSWQPWRDIAEIVLAVNEKGSGLSRHVTGDRGKVWHISANLAASPSWREGRIIVVARDVTTLVQMEGQLRVSETMAAMGALVSGVAHEVRNPLFAISATTDALEARLGGREGLGPFLTTLRGEVNRLGRLLQDLLDYGKPPALEMSDADVGEVVGHAVHACESLARERGVQVHNRVERGTLRARLDRSRVAQAVQNLVQNALHYSSAGMAVEIAGSSFAVDGRAWIEISVADHGPGFRPEELSRIFEPFYTRRRGGTGLGLSIVKRIAEAHGGTVDAGNGAGGGAVMTLALPASVSIRRDAASSPAVGSSPPSGSRT